MDQVKFELFRDGNHLVNELSWFVTPWDDSGHYCWTTEWKVDGIV
jgi:hypothetical protein